MSRPHTALRVAAFLAVAFVLLLSNTLALAADFSATLRRCTEHDFVATYGPCLDNSTRLRLWTRERNVSCVGVASVQPSATYVPCALCPAGMQHHSGDKGSVADCRGCPAGHYLDNTVLPSTCTVCPAGTAAVPVLEFHNGFDGFSAELSTLANSSVEQVECYGADSTPCTSRIGTGFEFVGYRGGDGAETRVGLRPSRANANATNATSIFTYTFEAQTDGWVEVTFVVQSAANQYAAVGLDKLQRNAAVLIVDDVEYSARRSGVPAMTDDAGLYHIFVPFQRESAYDASPDELTSSTHSLAWVAQGFARDGATTVVTLLSLVVSGDDFGGVEECVARPSGFTRPPHVTLAAVCLPGSHQSAKDAQLCADCTGNTVAPGYGFRACLPCENGGVANSGHTACEHNCLFTQEDALYNLTAMAGVVLTATREGASSSQRRPTEKTDGGRVSVSLCDALPIPNEGDDGEDGVCAKSLSGLNSSTSAYVCERTNTTEGRHFGSFLQLEKENGQVRMVTSFGSLVASADGRANTSASPEQTWRAVIQFECNPNKTDSGNDVGELRVDGMTENSLLLTWRSTYACPLCTEKSFAVVKSECNASKMSSVTYVKSNSSTCDGGFVPPAPLHRSCTACEESFYTLTWLACNASTKTQTGVYVLDPAHEGCVPPDSWEAKNESRSCTVSPVDTDTVKIVSIAVGGFGIVLACGLAVAALLAGRSQHEHMRLPREDSLELGNHAAPSEELADMGDHYNVAAADAAANGDDNDDGEAPTTAEARLASVADRLIATMSRTYHQATSGRTAGRRPPHAAADMSLSEEEDSHRRSQGSRGRRTQVMFALEDEDDDDILPPISPR